MPIFESNPGVEATAESEVFATHHERIRETVRHMDADAVARQLPNLVDTIASESTDAPGTMHFLIGVSFTGNHTLLDYRLDKYVVSEETDAPRYETLKSAVSVEHVYLTFPYPPDPNFTADALRGALLVEIEEQFSESGQRRGSGGASDRSKRRGVSRLEQLLKRVDLF